MSIGLKEHEENILVRNEITETECPVSLKDYGDGSLQLSTDSSQHHFRFLNHQATTLQAENKLKL